MELLMQEVKGHSDDRELEEEEEEEELEEEAEITKEESSSSKQYYPFFSTRQNSWLGLHDRHSPDATTTTDSHNSSSGIGLPSAPATNFFNNHSKPDLMDLSLGIENRNTKDLNEEEEEEGNLHAPGSSATNDVVLAIEKEHMFDKVVTPSDVGKLNRLVIPKQHAEKYFPLDSSSNEKGLLLNFEDRNGKLWRFRYSYWNSSQSYVMTKGWSRFVKEKKLDAGDIVSFQRGSGESHRHRLYIDYRRRPDHGPAGSTDPSLIAPFLLHQPPFSLRWGGRLYSLPSLPPPPMRPTTQVNYSNMFPFHRQQQHNEQYHHSHHHQHHPWQQQQQQQQQQHFHYNAMNSGSGSVYQNLIGQHEGGNGNENGNDNRNVPMIINSVPVDNYYQRHLRYHHHHHHSSGTHNTTTTAGKTLRLFGVNMECDTAASSSSLSEEPKCCNVITAMANSSSSSSSLPPPLQYLRVAHEDPISARFQNHHRQRGETSMLFDLDPSLQYKH